MLFLNPAGWPFSVLGLFSKPTPIPIPISLAIDTQENRFAITPSTLIVVKKPPTAVASQPPPVPEKPTASNPGVIGGAGKISFVSDRTGKFQIWMMNSDGSEQRQVTNLPDGACQPTWSPDGKKLAVISPCKEKSLIYPDAKIYTLNSDGSSPFPLMVSSGGDFDPIWSPDGKKIAFTSMRSEISHIFVYNFDTSSIEELSDTRFQDLHPTWSPSGKQLAFARRGSYNYHIWIMGDEGLTQLQFSANGNVDDFWPVWSPNGEFIVFSRSGPQPSVPYLYLVSYNDRNSGAEKLITAKDKAEPDPGYSFDISRDNQWLVFESWPDGRNHDIYKMDIEGNDFTRLTNDPGFDFDPVWLPNLEQ
jgi:Tol biopolymer transport system component